jgi:hypothetical protein
MLKFDILRVPPIQILPKKGKNLEFCSANFTVNQWQLASKKSLVFWAYFIRFGKRNNFVEEFFSIQALFRRENST